MQRITSTAVTEKRSNLAISEAKQNGKTAKQQNIVKHGFVYRYI